MCSVCRRSVWIPSVLPAPGAQPGILSVAYLHALPSAQTVMTQSCLKKITNVSIQVQFTVGYPATTTF